MSCCMLLKGDEYEITDPGSSGGSRPEAAGNCGLFNVWPVLIFQIRTGRTGASPGICREAGGLLRCECGLFTIPYIRQAAIPPNIKNAPLDQRCILLDQRSDWVFSSSYFTPFQKRCSSVFSCSVLTSFSSFTAVFSSLIYSWEYKKIWLSPHSSGRQPFRVVGRNVQPYYAHIPQYSH